MTSATDAEYNYAVDLLQDRKFTKALPIFRKLAKEGDIDAQSNLGAMYQHGHGVSKNLTTAAHWYLPAAKKGSTIAQYNIGIAYFYGQGVTQNRIEGLAWVHMSLWGGLKESEKVAGKMKNKMSKQQTDEALKRLVELNNEFGIFKSNPPPLIIKGKQ